MFLGTFLQGKVVKSLSCLGKSSGLYTLPHSNTYGYRSEGEPVRALAFVGWQSPALVSHGLQE